MTKTFRTFANRRDNQLMGFSSDDNAALLQDICTNSSTVYVRQMRDQGPVSVPAFAANAVADHLESLGWVKS